MGCLKLTYPDYNTELKIVHRKDILTSKNTTEKVYSNQVGGGLHKGYNNVVNANGNSTAQKFGFNGKELSEELGLHTLDFGARNYDPWKMRWDNIDNKADAIGQVHNSPYAYAMSNPIVFTDPDGNCPPGVNCYAAWLAVKNAGRNALSYLRGVQDRGSALTNSTSQAARRYTQPLRDYAQRASDVVTQVSRASAELRSSAISNHIAISKELYGIQAKMGGQGVGLTTGLKVVTSKVANAVDNIAFSADEAVVVVGQGMDRVHDAAKSLKANGLKNVEVFSPKPEALQEWNGLLKGLAEGEQLSDDVVKGTMLFKENQTWIKSMQKSGKTILDIGGNGSGKTSTFYEMEKSVIYGNQ